MPNQIVKYWVEGVNDYVCFRHAVAEAVAGKEISPEVVEESFPDVCYLCKAETGSAE